jgi:hypothetical protein
MTAQPIDRAISTAEQNTQLRYAPRLFVDRENEINLVKRTISDILDKKQQHSRTIIFRGQRGFGKSWLAVHLKREILRKITVVLPVFIGLGKHYGTIFDSLAEGEYVFSVQDKQIQLAELLDWLAKELHAIRITDAKPRERLGWIIQALQEKEKSPGLQPKSVLALIVDSAFEADKELREYIESELLAILAERSNVLIVMTGRGTSPSWQSHYINNPLTSPQMEGFVVDTFSEQKQQVLAHPMNDFVREQLEAQDFVCSDAELAQIKQMSGGYPLNNYLAASIIKRKTSWYMAFDQLLNFIEEPEKRAEIQLYIEALCLLKEGFREEFIPAMIEARRGERSQNTKLLATEGAQLAEARRIRDVLVGYKLMQFQKGRFYIDQAYTVMFGYYLVNEQKDLAKRLHERAAAIYQALQEEYGRVDVFEKLFNEHKGHAGDLT